MNIWVVKCNEHRDDGASWHWRAYFDGLDDDERTDSAYEFGGEDWIRHRPSMKLIRDEIRQGDIIVCYQTDQREILGFTRLASEGTEDPPHSGQYNVFHLVPADEAFVLERPLRVVEDLYRAGIHPSCFRNGTRGTMWPVEREDFEEMVRCIAQRSPDEADQLQAWLRRAGVRVTGRELSSGRR
jgi:hypothetical protein